MKWVNAFAILGLVGILMGLLRIAYNSIIGQPQYDFSGVIYGIMFVALAFIIGRPTDRKIKKATIAVQKDLESTALLYFLIPAIYAVMDLITSLGSSYWTFKTENIVLGVTSLLLALPASFKVRALGGKLREARESEQSRPETVNANVVAPTP